MIRKKLLNPDRVRRISGGFCFIPHRFLGDGFLASLGRGELLLYLFLALASDRLGLSFYGYDSICTLLEMSLDEYVDARNGLLEKDLIAFDGTVFQVLELPGTPPKPARSKKNGPQRREGGPRSLADIVGAALKEAPRD